MFRKALVSQSSIIVKALPFIFTFIYFIELVKTAWIGDDAGITLRTVMNFVNGYGPVYNVGERVQAYTHPLWFILLSLFTFITHNPFTSTFILCFTISVITAWILFRHIKDTGTLLIVGTALILSRALNNYSTSGLENPLSHLLVLSLFIIVTKNLEKGSLSYKASFLTGLAYLVRPDLIIVTIPIWIYALLKTKQGWTKQTWKMIAKHTMVMLSSIFAWTITSVIYYGTPLPNTAYAKTGATIPEGALIHEGFLYISDLVMRDPLTFLVIIVGMALGFAKKGIARIAALSILLYLGYVVYVGGDFMFGRFFTVPFILALYIISQTPMGKKVYQTLAIVVLIIILGVSKLNYTLNMQTEQKQITSSVVDERNFYYARQSLFTIYHYKLKEWQPNKQVVNTYIRCGGLGFEGLDRGPTAFLIDQCALADPLLARLPGQQLVPWRIGHFFRQIPTDYEESISTGKNLLKDKNTRDLYSLVREATRGNIFSSEWFNAVWKLNTKQYAKPSVQLYAHTYIKPHSDYKDFIEQDVYNFAPSTVTSITAALSNHVTYTVELGHKGSYRTVAKLKPNNDLPFIWINFIDIPISDNLPADSIRIRAVKGGPQYNIQIISFAGTKLVKK